MHDRMWELEIFAESFVRIQGYLSGNIDSSFLIHEL